MATTTNLGITKIEASDYVSPDPINTAFDTLDALGVDYIVEQSANKSGWWYRKWKSGRAECGIDSKSFGVVKLTGWGSLYMSQAYSFGAYPFTFKGIPLVTINFLQSTSNVAGGMIHIHARSDSSVGLTKSPDFSVVDATNVTYGTPTFGIYVEGRWK